MVDGDSPGYFITVSDYIHLNPVRANIVLDPEVLLKDRWSSAGWLAGSRKGCPKWLKWERVYGELGLADWKSKSRRQYRQYLAGRVIEVRKESGRHESKAWEAIQRGWCLGSEEFVDQLKEKLAELSKKPRESDSWAGAAVEEMEMDRATRLLAAGSKALGYARDEPLRGHDRTMLALWVRTGCRVRIPWLASQLGFKTRNSLSSSLSQIQRRIEKTSALQRQWKALNECAN